MKHTPAILAAALLLAACGDNRQAQLEAQLKAQQEQIAQQQAQLQALQNGAAQDQTVYQLQPEAVNETLSAQAQEQGKNGEIVTGNDGQQYMYDPSTGSWLLQSLIGAAAGAFIGNALANKFAKAPAGSPAAQQVRTQYAQQYRGRTAQAPATLSPRQQAAQNARQPQYRPTQQAQPNYKQPRRSGFGFGKRRR
ncbi:hypothetical protein V9W64_03630 [Neisseria leonii]|uniref:Membrane lipoprotein n=1 Tax=Neisseria leonii TaxID=2995413 RepID=A0A9X4E5V5_9NEIS|nr:hypothetical protein [Neisseria sp. 51.81]MDD9328441.1 hypothetical protein [Neisseria sp. 51.81]